MSQDDADLAQERRSRLLGIKLRALVGDHLGGGIDAEPVVFAPGAALLQHDQAWVLLDDRPRGSIGRCSGVGESGWGSLAERDRRS